MNDEIRKSPSNSSTNTEYILQCNEIESHVLRDAPIDYPTASLPNDGLIRCPSWETYSFPRTVESRLIPAEGFRQKPPTAAREGGTHYHQVHLRELVLDPSNFHSVRCCIWPPRHRSFGSWVARIKAKALGLRP